MGLLTRSGTTIGVLMLASYLGGWQFGWNELMVSAAGCGLALAGAGLFVIGRPRLDVSRSLSTDRVTVGDEAFATLSITNPKRTPVGPMQVEERSGGAATSVDVTGLGPSATSTTEHVLDTSTRGVIDVGPAVIAKSDPLGLMRREVDQAGVDQLWVQPQVVALHALPAGFAKDLEGPTSDTSPAGDVSFHTLREYEVGDDHRHVHWLSTARTGTLMVRHHVDNRRPDLTVVLDTDPVYDDETKTFELAVEAAASLVTNARLAQQPVALRCGTSPAPAPMDSLTTVEVDGSDLGHSSLTRAVRTALVHERSTSVLVIVTGSRPVSELLPVVEEAKRSVHVVVVRCCSATDGERLPATTTLDVDSLPAFQAAWNAAIRTSG